MLVFSGTVANLDTVIDSQIASVLCKQLDSNFIHFRHFDQCDVHGIIRISAADCVQPRIYVISYALNAMIASTLMPAYAAGKINQSNARDTQLIIDRLHACIDCGWM